MPRFHFDLGDSTHGPIGLAAAVHARTEREALERLKSHLPEELSVNCGKDDGIEYVRVYFNERAVTLTAIDEIEPD